MKEKKCPYCGAVIEWSIWKHYGICSKCRLDAVNE